MFFFPNGDQYSVSFVDVDVHYWRNDATITNYNYKFIGSSLECGFGSSMNWRRGTNFFVCLLMGINAITWTDQGQRLKKIKILRNEYYV
jgi:hypothetical protein